MPDMMNTDDQAWSFEATDDLPDEYRSLLLKLLTEHGEVITSRSYLAFIDSLRDRSFDLAPSEIEKVRTANFWAEEVRHGFTFYTLLSELGAEAIVEQESTTVKFEAFNVPLESWCDIAYLNCLTDRVGVYQAGEWAESSYLPLARVSAGIVRDERGHANLGYQRLKALCETSDGLAEASRRITYWWPAALDMFGRSGSRRNDRYRYWGLKKCTNEELRNQFTAEARPLLEELAIEVPPDEEGRSYL